jgi:hypothetical protein
LCITLTCPYQQACPCLNAIHDQFRIHAWKTQQVDRCCESSRACRYMFYLSERCCQSVCCSNLALCRKKNKRLLLTGMRRPAEWRGSWAQIQRPTADLLATSFSPIYFSLRPGFTATLSSKRSENNIESRATIGFNPIVHKEHISPLLPFATTPHRACCGVPPSPHGRGDAPWNMIADSMHYSVA